MNRYIITLLIIMGSLVLANAYTDEDDEKKKASTEKINDDEGKEGDKDDKDESGKDTLDDHGSGEIEVGDTLVYEDFDSHGGGGSSRTGGEVTGGQINDDWNPDMKEYWQSPTRISWNQRENNSTLELEEPSVSVYPNPAVANSEVHVEVKGVTEARVMISDISGRIIFTDRIEEKKSTVHGLANGSYVISVDYGSGVQTTRLIVQ